MKCCAVQRKLKPDRGTSGESSDCTATLSGLIGDNMAQIKLTQGKYAIVDDELYGWLNRWNWCAMKSRYTYYAIRRIWKNNKYYAILMHRQILNLKYGDGKFTDHKNLNGLDNRKNNIRICSRSQNRQNSPKHKVGTSIYRGVVKVKGRKTYRTYIRKNKTNIYVGYFRSEIDAARAYDIKAKELFGEYAYTNF